MACFEISNRFHFKQLKFWLLFSEIRIYYEDDMT